MLEPTYGQALAHAWRLVARHKAIWVFGLLSLAVGHFGLNAFVGQLLSFADVDLFSRATPWWPENVPLIALPNLESVLWFIWLVIILAALAVFIVVVAVFSQGALIAASGEWFRKRASPNLTRAWRKGVRHFWRLLAVDAIQKIGLAIVLFFTTLSIRAVSGESVAELFATILIATLGILFAIAVSSVTIYAAGYVVEEELGLQDALAAGWLLFARHLLVSVELSIILLLLNAAVLAVIFFGSIITLAPAFLLWLVAGTVGSTGILSLGVALGGFLLILFIAFVGALFNAFTISAWMYLFMKMHHEGLGSRLFHFLGKLLRR